MKRAEVQEMQVYVAACGATGYYTCVHIRTTYRSVSGRVAVFFTSLSLRTHCSSLSIAGTVILPTGCRKQHALL